MKTDSIPKIGTSRQSLASPHYKAYRHKVWTGLRFSSLSTISILLRRYRHSAWWKFRLPLRSLSAFLPAFAPCPLQALHRYYAGSDFSARLSPHGDLPASRTLSSAHSVATHSCIPQPRFNTLPLNGLGFPSQGLGFTHSLAGSPVARAVSHSLAYGLDVSLPIAPHPVFRRCFQHPLSTTQLCSGSGRRAFARGGLSPP